ncbi:SRPBCC domain-containing protein [Pedobacter sp. HMF7647]|uniref:SRPBCC domain-containing protein n=1 Tax=Hufsiella arboris TaxID=2695275 RepID=A0A7K1Y7S3_9SPHI|nr:SRPBCC family protein [Hufsiella arboris]MXV50169.1 SRPBCC domain-containing protein [Hufsiella arboris]
MKPNLTAETSTTINASPQKVWKALTDPEQIKQYLFGTTATSDWKKRSKITYTGEWQGKSYEDKGEIVDIIPEKKLHTTYLSGMSGKEDIPENYNNVIYTLTADGAQTIVTIQQDNIATKKEIDHMKENWALVLQNMKKLLES